jgi:hypothetical protein
MGRIRTFLPVLIAFLITGCTASTSAPDAGSPAPNSTGSTGSTAPTSPATHTVALGDADRGRTVPVAVGDQVIITLTSTYWRFTEPNPPAILVPTDTPTVNPSPPSEGRCVPGGGCGTVSITFRATKPGTTVASASRTSCGEARGCTGDAGSYQVTVVVR